MTNSSRRQFLGISARTAGKVAATGLVSLPMLASLSKKADALGWMGWHDDPSPGHGGGSGKCFLRGTLVQTPDGEIPVEELTIGTLVGPVLAGVLIQEADFRVALIIVAALTLVALPFSPPSARRKVVIDAHRCTAAAVRD